MRFYTFGYACAEPETVKVPQMAESITEGTLKQWQKKVGQHVEQDEEVATIETDKVQSSASFTVPTRLPPVTKD